MSDRELWVVNLHVMSTDEKRVAWCGDRTENTWKRHLTLRHRGRWRTFKRGRGAGLIWENLGGGMKGTHQSQWITIRNQVLMAELWRRCQWTGVEAFFSLQNGVRPEGWMKGGSYFEVKKGRSEGENITFFCEVRGSERRGWGIWRLEKGRIDWNCCHREQDRQLLKMNKRISEQPRWKNRDI